jgi:transposase
MILMPSAGQLKERRERLSHLRVWAVKEVILRRQSPVSVGQKIERYGIRAKQIYAWLKEYRRWAQRWGRDAAFEMLKGKKSSGRPRLLDKNERAWLIKALKRPPRYHGFPINEWTLDALIAVIRKRTGKSISHRTMKRWRIGWLSFLDFES